MQPRRTALTRTGLVLAAACLMLAALAWPGPPLAQRAQAGGIPAACVSYIAAVGTAIERAEASADQDVEAILPGLASPDATPEVQAGAVVSILLRAWRQFGQDVRAISPPPEYGAVHQTGLSLVAAIDAVLVTVEADLPSALQDPDRRIRLARQLQPELARIVALAEDFSRALDALPPCPGAPDLVDDDFLPDLLDDLRPLAATAALRG